MGEPAELSDKDRASALAIAMKIVEAVTNDWMLLGAVHDYGDTSRFVVAENMAIDGTKFADIDASADIEIALLTMAQRMLELEENNAILVKAARMDAAERHRFRAWCVARRDRVVEKALEIAKHWGEQGGVNGKLLDDLAELAGHPTRGYRRDT